MERMNGTRFMTQEELQGKLTEIDLTQESGWTAGGLPLLVRDNKAYVDTGDSHSIIFGATGSKKTRLLGMPTVEILSGAGESFVVTDPKGEIYDKTVGNVKQRGYQVYCLNLRDMKEGNTWNPLMLPYRFYRNGERGKAVEMVSELAKMMVGEAGNDPFWPDSAADVITGLMVLLLESATKDECHIKSLLALWEQYRTNKEKTIKTIKEIYPKSLITRKLGTLDNSSDKTVGSIESVTATALNRLMANEEFVDFLSRDGMEFYDITKEKTAIYLIIPDENTFYHFIVSLFLEQLYEVLIKEAQRMPDHRLAIRMNYIVDEFANIPKIENMGSMITAARSRNIRFHLIVQSKMQLKNKYEDMASVICDNCNNWVYLYSKDYDLLSEISNLCGKVIYDNHMTMPLISEFELQHLNKEEGEALVLSGRNYPCIVNLADIDAYPAQKESHIREFSDGRSKARAGMTFLSRQPADIFKLDRYVKKRIAGDEIDAYTFPVKNNWRKRLNETGYCKDVWLVGTYNGMIIAEDMVSEEEIESGEGILRISCRQFDRIEDTMQLKWYWAPKDLEHTHTMEVMVDNIPTAFMTIEEMGIENFTPVERKIPECLKGGL